MLAGLLAIITMMLHPSISSTDPLEQIEEIRREFSINAHVHGLMIIYGLLSSACLIYFFVCRSCCKALNVFAITFYVAGSAAMIGAALVSGFIFPEFAVHLDGDSPNQASLYLAIRQYSWSANQALAYFGAYAWSAAMVLGSLSLFYGTKFERLAGVLCIAIGVLSLFALAGGWLSLDVFGMRVIMTGQGVWYFSVAYCLFLDSKKRQDLPPFML